jgi:NAD(P)-dependent dehydrogenase (short-subunit alcohol dehydrogenase family)
LTEAFPQPVALITGASRGIGAAVAIELARRGWHVVITARTQGGLEETDDAVRAAGGRATLLPLDLAEGEPIDRLGPSIYDRFGRLDVLVGSAGVLGRLTPVSHIQERDFRAAMAVNVEATWRLIRTAAPVLLAAPAGRAVFVTTGVVRAPHAYWGLYGATKAAMDHLVQCWAAETRTTRLRVNLFDPGVVATRLRREAFPGENQATLRMPQDVAPAIADLCRDAEARHGEVVRFAEQHPIA